MWMSDRQDSYQPPIELGASMVGVCLAEISKSSNPNFKEGDLVRGFGEWADYANVDSDSFLVLEEGHIYRLKVLLVSRIISLLLTTLFIDFTL